jgi:hypothetical protein
MRNMVERADANAAAEAAPSAVFGGPLPIASDVGGTQPQRPAQALCAAWAWMRSRFTDSLLSAET